MERRRSGRACPAPALLVVNRFGRRAAGRGLVPAITAALDRGVPVLLGVSAMNLPDFLTFAASLAQPLPPDPAAVPDWLQAPVSAAVA